VGAAYGGRGSTVPSAKHDTTEKRKERLRGRCGAIELHFRREHDRPVNEDDRRVFKTRLANERPAGWSTGVPFREELEALGVKWTYKWHWLVEGLMEKGRSLGELGLRDAAANQHWGWSNPTGLIGSCRVPLQVVPREAARGGSEVSGRGGAPRNGAGRDGQGGLARCGCEVRSNRKERMEAGRREVRGARLERDPRSVARGQVCVGGVREAANLVRVYVTEAKRVHERKEV